VEEPSDVPPVPYPTSALWLCGSGFLLVLFAGSLGVMLSHKSFGGGSWGYTLDDANRATETVRWVGALLFAGGLTERLVGALRSTRTGR
jgi:hypothetical protein